VTPAREPGRVTLDLVAGTAVVGHTTYRIERVMTTAADCALVFHGHALLGLIVEERDGTYTPCPRRRIFAPTLRAIADACRAKRAERGAP
jgi:hypothetical protein